MSETTSEKKVRELSKHVKTCRLGAVAANIFVRQAPGGFEYLVLCLSRSWKTSGGKEGYSQNFFAKNREALHTVIDEACDFIDEETRGADSAEKDTPAKAPETTLKRPAKPAVAACG